MVKTVKHIADAVLFLFDEMANFIGYCLLSKSLHVYMQRPSYSSGVTIQTPCDFIILNFDYCLLYSNNDFDCII